MKTIAYIQTGSNEGDRLAHLSRAARNLDKQAGQVIKSSSVYETAAWGVADQPDFLNQVLAIKTDRPPFELLDTLLRIEADMGRQRRVKWGQRRIDIDLLFYGSIRIDTDRLKVPHPYLQERKFVLQPLLEIAPELYHPELHARVEELAARCEDGLRVRVYEG